MSSSVSDLPLGLGDSSISCSPLEALLNSIPSFPETVWVLGHENGLVHMMQTVPSAKPVARGLCVWSSKDSAIAYLESDAHPFVAEEWVVLSMSFDEARALAKTKPSANSVVLMDNPFRPAVHYID